MATRSTIWINLGNEGSENKDDKFRGIYCHFDGYLEGVGETLLNHYNDIEKINKLIDLGSISSLSEHVETDQPHSFDKPLEGVVVAYARDRGEDLNVFEVYGLENTNQYGEVYNYVFDGNDWKLYEDGLLKDLKELLDIQIEISSLS